MRIAALLFLVMEVAQWLLIVYLFAANRQLRGARDTARFATDPPRSVVDSDM